MRLLVHTKIVAGTTIKSMMSSTGFGVPIAEIVDNMGDRDVDEYLLPDMKEALMTVADNGLSIERSLSRSTKT